VPVLSPIQLLAVALAHAVLLGLLLAPDTPAPVTPARPLTVSLITPETETPQPKPQPSPARPTPQANPLPPPPPLAARATALPARQQPAIETPQPTPVLDPMPDVVPPTPAAAVEAAQAAPPPPTPPRPADYLNNPKPPYPALSKRLGEEGVVRLNILVSPDGSVARLELARSSGHARLDESAMKTVQASWKFEPATQAGKPVAAWVIVPIQFTLRS